MEKSCEALSMILDSITEHIIVINEIGEIQYVNKNWSTFGDNNTCSVGDWRGVNYIDECNKASVMGDSFGDKAKNGIESVISKEQSIFYLEYPCHSPHIKRWFMMRVTSFQISQKDYFVISHQNITERKLAEEEVRNLANTDGLTNIPNRRVFDEFLNEEWKRCLRLKKSISLILIDLDHFKLLNDNYGHQFGDECLVKIGWVLKRFDTRPSEICARYGGEEFALVLGDTTAEKAKLLSEKLLEDICALNIPHSRSPIENYLTVSIGLATMTPKIDSNESELIKKADEMLYKAKGNGKNQIGH